MTPTRRAVLAAAGASAVLTLPIAATASDRAVIDIFYKEYLSAGPKDRQAIASAIFAPGWKSIGDYSGKSKTAEELTRQIGGFHALIPDLKWDMEDVIQAGSKFVVRGRASGTPKGPMMGVDGQGRGFTIMSIDIHEMAGGRIATTYHVEDWATGLRQLAGR
jgi:predicted ester cyclase